MKRLFWPTKTTSSTAVSHSRIGPTGPSGRAAAVGSRVPIRQPGSFQQRCSHIQATVIRRALPSARPGRRGGLGPGTRDDDTPRAGVGSDGLWHSFALGGLVGSPPRFQTGRHAAAWACRYHGTLRQPVAGCGEAWRPGESRRQEQGVQGAGSMARAIEATRMSEIPHPKLTTESPPRPCFAFQANLNSASGPTVAKRTSAGRPCPCPARVNMRTRAECHRRVARHIRWR